MADYAPFLLSLAALLLNWQGGEYAGEKTLDRLVSFLRKTGDADKIRDAFHAADACFKQECGDDTLRQMIISKPFAALPSLEKLAASLPKTLDDDGLLAALRRRFEDDWSGKLAPEQLDHAAVTYRLCP